MCINKKRFYNKWFHSWQWVDCGKCPECQQAKANRRTKRINYAVLDGYIKLFVTLTYRNINIPYINKDELRENVPFINVYRDCTVRRVRLTSDYKMAYKYIRKKVVVSKIDCFEHRLFPSSKDVSSLTKLRGQSDRNKVGVLFYKDIQNFEKRLRINLVRRFGVEKPIYTFKCSEYGPSTLRPHFHLLISVPQESLAECQSAIVESWPFDSRVQSAKSIQIARNAASYVSSYVNRGSAFPNFLDSRVFRPKHSFSKGYGTSFGAFSLEQILKSFRRGDLRFNPSEFGLKSSRPAVIYPKYACNRYFVKCYGYSRMSYDEIVDYCVNPVSFFETSDITARMYLSSDVCEFIGNYEYDWEKIHSNIRLILRLRSRFCRDFVYYEDGHKFVGLPENEYSYRLFADYYYRFWRTYASTVLKMQYEDLPDEEIPYLFENWDDVFEFGIRSDVLSLPRREDSVMCNPNLFQKNINLSALLRRQYKDTFKRKKITNKVMCDNNFNV